MKSIVRIPTCAHGVLKIHLINEYIQKPNYLKFLNLDYLLKIYPVRSKSGSSCAERVSSTGKTLYYLSSYTRSYKHFVLARPNTIN